MLNTNFLKTKLSHQSPVIGTWATLPSTTSSEILALSGLDFIVIDREHGAVSFETAKEMSISCENRGVSPLLRVSDLSLSEVQRALDLGVHGLHVPNVESADQLETLIRYAKYPPRGNRGFSPFTRAAKYSSNFAKEQVQTANESTLLVIHIEGKEALENLDQFLKFPEIDVIFIGLYDLSKSLGIPGEVEHLEVKKYLMESVIKIRKAGKTAGSIAMNITQMHEFLDLGINYITYSADCNMLYNAYAFAAQAHKDYNKKSKGQVREYSWN